MNDTYKVRSIGGALVVTLPQHVVRFTQLVPGDLVNIQTHKNGTILIVPTTTQLERVTRNTKPGSNGKGKRR